MMTNVYLPASTDPAETAKERASRLAVRGAIAAGLAAALAVAMTGTASAQPVNDGGSTTGNVEVESSIDLSALTPSFLLTGIPGATVGPALVTYNVKTNNTAGYTVTVASTLATMMPVNPVTNLDRIPIGALKVMETGGTFSPVTDTTQVVHTQGVRSLEAGDALSTSYQVVIPFVKSDTYTATINYVATTL